MVIKLGQVNIELTEQVLKILKKYVQRTGENESGGILLGGFIPSINKYIITNISEPCNKDIRGSSFFIRNRENAQRVIDEFWKNSCGKINYLGEWHTHGCEMPYPSFTDKRLLKMIMEDESNVWNEIFMLIVGKDASFYIGMTNVRAKGRIVAEVLVEEECDAYIFC